MHIIENPNLRAGKNIVQLANAKRFKGYSFISMWYLASEGAALSDSDVWLDHFENPRGCAISSQDITRLLDRMNTDDIMTFYKEWLDSIKKPEYL
jgi:hypothetical protein